MVNDFACDLFCYSRANLIGKRFQELLADPGEHPGQTDVMEEHLSSDGEMIPIGGNVVSLL